ncbi:porin [Longimonas halophila]|uniref:Porin n=1 Tax=Longimonas halophila TaxID=1469170 RepID=A0A2H3NLZ9_9BACT|nr:porin [Longimonas halophila]
MRLTDTSTCSCSDLLSQHGGALAVLGLLLSLLLGAPAAHAQSVFADAGGFRIADDDGDYQLRIGGDLQTDARMLLGDTPGTSSSFFLRRARVRLSATLQRRFSIRFMSDFGRGQATIQDAYIDFRFGSGLSLRAGRFSTPLGLEFLQSSNATMHVERGYPTAFVSNRDVGFQLYGRTLGQRLQYSVGVFNGAPDGTSLDGDATPPKDLIARAFIEPWRNNRDASDWLRGLGAGLGVSVGTERSANGSSGLASYRTLHRSALFSYRGGVEADGRRMRLVPQAYYYAGPFGVIGEYALSQHDVQRGDNTETLAHRAWQIGGSWVLTGESASYGGVSPENSYDPEAGTWGAFELSAKVQRFQFDEDAFPQYADPEAQVENGTSLAAGLSWYPVRNVRFMTVAERTTFGGTEAANARDAEHTLTMRVQLSY